MGDSFTCDLCGKPLAAHAYYIVRMDIFADPSVPAIHTDETTEPAETIDDLLKQIESMSEEELQDQVFRRFYYRLCPLCHGRFLANPLGKPRQRAPGTN